MKPKYAEGEGSRAVTTTEVVMGPDVLVIRNVHLAGPDLPGDPGVDTIYDVICVDGHVRDVRSAAIRTTETTADELDARREPFGSSSSSVQIEELDGEGKGVLLPALCHAHIHLDKCFLLDKPGCDELVSGDFAEALRVTAKAKRDFPSDLADLYQRGERLITESVQCGVTAMRAHVEVDNTVHMHCLDVGLKLRQDFQNICEVQIAVFAQDPLFAAGGDEEPGVNWKLLQEAVVRDGVQAIGSAPYVEPSTAQAKKNIDLILDLVHQHGLHADFHLDYNLSHDTEPLVWYLVAALEQRIAAQQWDPSAQVCVGHATRLTLFSPRDWETLSEAINQRGVPITFVGLPPSDIYLMGRDLDIIPRGTLNVPLLKEKYKIQVAMAVNNVGNAFTPQGPLDPLALCPLGVALFQAGTKAACETLLEAVTIRARHAIGVTGLHRLTPKVGDTADFVLLHENADSAYSAALSPAFSRTTIKKDVIVAQRKSIAWTLK